MEHPFYPRDLHLPGYVPNKWTTSALFGGFGAAVGLVAVATWTLSGLLPRKRLTPVERAIMTWWAMTGTIHLVMEGAFVVSPNFYADKTNNFFSDAWKEYSKSDSRYVQRDSFIVSVEAVTAFVEGPLCFVIVYAIGAQLAVSSLLQLLVAFGQLYGAVLYFATDWLEGSPNCHPHPLYFWVYFVGMNSIWVVVPGLIAIRCFRELHAASAAYTQSTRAKSD